MGQAILRGDLSMQIISNEALVEAYQKALELKLDFQFIELLHNEIIRRGLQVDFKTFTNVTYKRNRFQWKILQSKWIHKLT